MGIFFCVFFRMESCRCFCGPTGFYRNPCNVFFVLPHLVACNSGNFKGQNFKLVSLGISLLWRVVSNLPIFFQSWHIQKSPCLTFKVEVRD